LGEFGSAGFIPEGKFDAIPESEFVVDNPEVVLDDVFGGANFVGDVAILESLGNKFNDAVFAFTGDPVAVTFDCKHSCLL
jgi:hypothetical protein